jgi:hypothetical protein
VTRCNANMLSFPPVKDSAAMGRSAGVIWSVSVDHDVRMARP